MKMYLKFKAQYHLHLPPPKKNSRCLGTNVTKYVQEFEENHNTLMKKINEELIQNISQVHAKKY